MFLFLWKYEKNSHWLLDRDFIPNLKRLYCCLVMYMPSIVLNRMLVTGKMISFIMGYQT